MASRTSRKEWVRGLPSAFGVGRNDRKRVHSASERSVGYVFLIEESVQNYPNPHPYQTGSKSAGVVRRIAISEHCLWVSIPRCRRASWKVVSICQRKTNHLRSAQGPQGRHQDRCTARPGWRKHLADRAPVPSV